MARPKKKPEDIQGKVVACYLTDDEYGRILQKAKLTGKVPSRFLIDLAVDPKAIRVGRVGQDVHELYQATQALEALARSVNTFAGEDEKVDWICRLINIDRKIEGLLRLKPRLHSEVNPGDLDWACTSCGGASRPPRIHRKGRHAGRFFKPKR